METCSTDFYEKQLLSVFESYDVENRGSLDRDGLVQLCSNLQLEDQGLDLVKCLLSDGKKYVTFTEFKDGLLSLLRQKTEYVSSDNESEASDREVLPKFTYGSKKYGRRSRPEKDEDENGDEVFIEKIENKTLKQCNKVQRSNSQNDVTHSKKRKTSTTLKRCTSFPGNHEMEKQFSNETTPNIKSQINNLEYNENMLRSLVDHLNVGKDGYLSFYQLKSVCESLGLQKPPPGAFYQLMLKAEANKRVSLDELMEAFRKEDCWYEMNVHTATSTVNDTCIAEDSILFPNIKTLQFITLGPNGTGMIAPQVIVDMWENAGITSASNLLHELGFTDPQINIADLASMLDEELRNLNDARSNVANMSPHIALLQASIALYQSEVKYLRSVLEQLSAERDKLKVDIADANHRASLLAQEVDDNHAKMERNSQNQVRLLEQRHTEILKEQTSQFISEKEHISVLNNQLENKVFELEAEENKLRSDLLALQKYNGSLEKENNVLTNQLSEMQQIHSLLTSKVTVLENECQKITDMERERGQLELLLEKLSLLQKENAELRDKNDELCSEVEMLNSQCTNMRSKVPSLNISMSGDDNIHLGEGLGLGAIKRRVDSPTKDVDFDFEFESPRLGKVRRCYNKPQLADDALDGQPPNPNESGFDAELECGDSSLSYIESEDGGDEILRLKERIKYLERLIQDKKSDSTKSLAPISHDFESNMHLIKHCKELETILDDVRQKITTIIQEKPSEDQNSLIYAISQLNDKLQNIKINSDDDGDKCSISTQTEQVETTKPDDELKEECETLRQSLVLMRNEIENCENYWSKKLDDERKLFEQEQSQSTEKLNELLQQICEYEEQFNHPDRLPPIEENKFEQQFTELEDEMEQCKLEMTHKDEEIYQLHEQLNELQVRKCFDDKSVQVNLFDVSGRTELDITTETLWQTPDSSNSHKQPDSIDATLLLNPHVQERGYINPQQQPDSIDSTLLINAHIQERDYINPMFVWNKENTPNPDLSAKKTDGLIIIQNEDPTCSSLPPNLSWQPSITITTPQPHSICNIPTNNSLPLQNTGSCRPKRNRKYDRNNLTSQLRSQKKEDEERSDFQNKLNRPNSYNDSFCTVRVSSLHSLNGRLFSLDKHCRVLQLKLKTQQRYSENMLHQYWQQHIEEMNELQMEIKFLQEKLMRSDMLIKDLYIETSYLKANNERLEHRCHMLVQSNSESTSV